MKDKCRHSVVILSTKVGPHIHACLKCRKYNPDPHPSLTEEEVQVLIDFSLAMREKFEQEKKSRKEK